MSKSKGNVVDPWQMVQRYGADAVRWYFYTINQPGDAKLFSERDLERVLKKFIITFWNCYSFFGTYAFSKIQKSKTSTLKLQPKSEKLLDRWIISKLNGLILEVTNALDKYDITGAARAIEYFVVEDLSQWYIRRSRPRFQKPKTEKELKEASEVLGFVLLTISKLTAPFIPFLSERIYKELQVKNYKLPGPLSVHLEDWPKSNRGLIDKGLEEKMVFAREIVRQALKARAEAGIKVRQPLTRLKIKKSKFKIPEELLELIREEVNVKELVFDEKIKRDVELDIKITPELKEEGFIREFIRNLQELRKKAGLTPKDKIKIFFSGPETLSQVLIKNKEIILKETRAQSLNFCEKAEMTFEFVKNIKLDNQKLWFKIERI